MVNEIIEVTPSTEIDPTDLELIIQLGKKEGLTLKPKGYYKREQAGTLDPLIVFTFNAFSRWLANKAFDSIWNSVKETLKGVRKTKTKKGVPSVLIRIEDKHLSVTAHPAQKTQAEFQESLNSLPEYIMKKKKLSDWIFYDTKTKRWITAEDYWNETNRKK